MSPRAARWHPRFGPRGRRTPYCQTPVRDGPKRGRLLSIYRRLTSPACRKSDTICLSRGAVFAVRREPTVRADPTVARRQGHPFDPTNRLPECIAPLPTASARTPPRQPPPCPLSQPPRLHYARKRSVSSEGHRHPDHSMREVLRGGLIRKGEHAVKISSAVPPSRQRLCLWIWDAPVRGVAPGFLLSAPKGRL